MARRIVCAVDLDEVLGQYVKTLVRFHNHKFKSKLSFNDFRSYDFVKVWGGTYQQSNDILDEFYKSHFFNNEFPVIPGALETLEKFNDRYKFVVTTARRHVITEETKQWVEKHYKDIFDSEEILLGNEAAKEGEPKLSKSEMCQQIDAKILIDDSRRHAIAVSPYVDKVFLFDWNYEYGWNKDETFTKENKDKGLPDNVIRLKNWTEVADELHKYLTSQ